MTANQWRKVELRLRHIMRQNHMANIILWEGVNGVVHLQVVGGKTEHITDNPSRSQD